MDKVKTFFKKRKDALLHLLGSVGLLAISAIIGIILGLNKANDVEKYVNEAIEYFKENNWIAFYNYAEVVDNDFINEVLFSELAEELYGEVSEREIVIEEIREDNGTAEVDISYKTMDGKSHKLVLDFTEKDEKTYVFFSKWKLNVDELIVKDSKFTVPTGAVLYVDGIELTSDNAKIARDEATGTETYTIPRLFQGHHVVYADMDGFEVIEKEVELVANNTAFSVDTKELVLVQNTIDGVYETAKDIVVGMYSAIFNESGIIDVTPYLKQDEATQAIATAVYNNMLAAIKPEDGSTLNSMEFTSFNNDTYQYTYPDEMNVQISFECTFEARGKRNKKGGVREKYSGTSGSTISLHFVKVGDNWYCDNLDMVCIDYSKKEEATQ